MTAWVVSAPDRRTLTRSYPGQRKHIRLVRATLALLLEDCPLAGDAVLIASELAANAVVHSNSAAPGGRFTVRAVVCPGQYVRIEVDDQGGQWTPRDRDEDRPHGLDLIDALAGTGNWGIHGDAEYGRTAWARLDWPDQRDSPDLDDVSGRLAGGLVPFPLGAPECREQASRRHNGHS
jgi:anti-sigma regulatory factor (Ser/Thr protein kinase)